MEFMVRYGISIVLIGIVWGLVLYTLDPMVVAVAVVVTTILVKGKLNEDQD